MVANTSRRIWITDSVINVSIHLSHSTSGALTRLLGSDHCQWLHHRIRPVHGRRILLRDQQVRGQGHRLGVPRPAVAQLRTRHLPEHGAGLERRRRGLEGLERQRHPVSPATYDVPHGG